MRTEKEVLADIHMLKLHAPEMSVLEFTKQMNDLENELNDINWRCDECGCDVCRCVCGMRYSNNWESWYDVEA